MITCKNCQFEFEGKFCNNCGQKAKTERLDWKYVSDEAKYTFLHFNGGFAHTAKQLFTRPGDSIREFIEGRRVGHYKPLLFLFVLAGIYGVLMHYIDFSAMPKPMSGDTPEAQRIAAEINEKITSWMVNHYSIVELIQLPIYAFCSWIAFRKWGYNFIEHLILNSFASSQRIIVNIVLVPLLIFASYFSKNIIWLVSFVGFGSFGFTIWTIATFFRGRDSGQLILRMLLFCVVMVAVIMLAVAIGSLAFILSNPEFIQSLKPKN